DRHQPRQAVTANDVADAERAADQTAVPDEAGAGERLPDRVGEKRAWFLQHRPDLGAAEAADGCPPDHRPRDLAGMTLPLQLARDDPPPDQQPETGHQAEQMDADRTPDVQRIRNHGRRPYRSLRRQSSDAAELRIVLNAVYRK